MLLQFFYDFLIHIFNLFNEDKTKQCHNSTPYCISYFNTIVTNYNSHANYKRLANTVLQSFIVIQVSDKNTWDSR